ncbi:hypothetical protein [Dyadobacter crusticola]|uniref:hypothetical protein n=1 Tax=Dyadobacter crusticola TaxID=292407 RepID=UPI0004E0EF6B|nr:hypothetical protein [Dyadobacter crusticola]
MKTIKLLLIFLVLFSFRAGATGYVHNMFVAHKKLQAGKEVVIEKAVVKKHKSIARTTKPAVQAKSAALFNTSLAGSNASVTLNERILEEGPSSFFKNEKSENADDSIVTKIIGAFRCMVYAFVGSTPLGNS